jgi:hypothetical protein
MARMLRENQDTLVAAINADYRNRATFETLFGEVFAMLQEIKHTCSRPAASYAGLPCGFPSAVCLPPRLAMVS